MSNQQNEELKESIMEEILSMTLHDFHYTLEDKKLKYQAEELDIFIDELVNAIFEERAE